MNRLSWVACVVCALLFLNGAWDAWGVSILVDTTADETNAVDGLTSLREAVQQASLLAGDDTIVLPPGTYSLTIAGSNEDACATGDLDITDSLTILGSEAAPTILHAGGLNDRAFHILPGASLTVSNLNVTGAAAADAGGAFLNSGGTLRLAACAVYSNSARLGGAVFNAGGTSTIFQCTLANNVGAQGSGAIGCDAGNVRIEYATVAGNSCVASNGGGIGVAAGASVSLLNSLVASNSAAGSGPNLSGTFNSLGYNLIASTSGATLTNVVVGNITGVGVPLGSLQNNGGPTLTRATVPGNPAIDGGNPAFAPPPVFDQRGLPRVFNGRMDIGAFEFQYTNIVVTTTNDEVNFLNASVSLREATIIANLQSVSSNRITLGAGTYRLGLKGGNEDYSMTGDLNIRSLVNIQGAGATQTVIDAGGLDRVCSVASTGTAIFADVMLRGGSAARGAGLYNDGNLLLTRCCVRDNTASVYGGGIEQHDGVLSLMYSTVCNNEGNTPGGGGIDVIKGVVDIRESTISQNTSPRGAGIYREGGEVQMSFSTIAGNAAQHSGGGIYIEASAGALTMANSLVASNTAPSSPDILGLINSLGYNFIGNDSGATGFVATDLRNADPGLMALAYNGGTTPTHGTAPDSPLINAGDPAAAVDSAETDQRCESFLRKRGVRVDIGAFEYPDPDEDGDGIPDEWEMRYDMNPTNAADASADGDGDNIGNLQEYWADTIPTNGYSYPYLIKVEEQDGTSLVTFQSSTNRVYTLQASDGAAGWSNIAPSVTGHPGSTTVSVGSATNCRLYRVSARLP